MNEYNFNTGGEPVPVKVSRIFDSCSDKDCLSELPVTINCGCIPQDVNIVRSRCASVESTCISVEPVPFNKGFYSIDINYTFSIEILCYERACSAPTVLTGTAHASKNCILYGSESTVKIFTNNADCTEKSADEAIDNRTLPLASVSVLEPVVLETKIGKGCPAAPEKAASANFPGEREIFVTLGIFSVVELSRPVTLMLPTLDYTIPKKDRCCESDSPCEVFDKLRFPEEEFSPAALNGNSEIPDCEGLDEAMS